MPPLREQPAIAVVGATGLVGRELLSILAERGLDRGEVRLFASQRSAGGTLPVGERAVALERIEPGSFRGLDVAFFCAGADVSRRFAPAAADEGACVVDNSSAFRMDPAVPLVVPEINGDVLDRFEPPGLIANPNCSTIIALMAVTPLHRAAGVRRMVISTYQAASGGGAEMLEELKRQAQAYALGGDAAPAGRYLFLNVFCHESPVGADGCNGEETKMVRETRRIWDDGTVAVTATCVRVPVLRAHSEAINLTLEKPLTEAEARDLLSAAAGVRVLDDREANRFPEPVEATGHDEVLVGRIRADASQPPGRGLDLFACGDQLRKGAALNAVQIAERVLAARSVTT